MTTDNLWTRYSATWSQPSDDRLHELRTCVSEGVTYCDPHEIVVGRARLSDYMGDFQSAAPGYHFHIESVLTHHERSLARWTLRSPGDDIVQEGTSFAELSGGLFSRINGFFAPITTS